MLERIFKRRDVLEFVDEVISSSNYHNKVSSYYDRYEKFYGSSCALFLFFVYRRADAGGFTNPLTTRCLLYVSPVSDFFERKTSPSGDSWDAFHCDRDPLRGADLEFQCI